MSRQTPWDIAQSFADNMARSAEIAMASQSVIGARVALGLEAAHSPRMSHVVEATRMTGEKVSTFSEAAVRSAPSAAKIGDRMTTAALREASAAMTAGAAAASATPLAAAAIGTQYALDASRRMCAVWTSMASLAVGAQAAALAPVHRTATLNAARLKR